MKKEALIAKYRIKDEGNIGFNLLESMRSKPRSYIIPINGNKCKVMVSETLGVVHISASIFLSDVVARVPTYAECLIIKQILFEENENLVFGISNNPYMNYSITNPFCMHMYIYSGKMPPFEKIMAIEDYKKDGDYKIKKGNTHGWNFVRITGDYFPDMEELKVLKEKYFLQRNAAIILLQDALILLNNPKEGIVFNKMKMK